MRETRKGAPLQEPITELSEDGKRKAEEKVGKKQKAEEPEEEEEDVSSMQAAVPSELPCRGWGRVRGGEDGQVQALCAREEGQGPGGLRGVGVRSRDVSRCLEDLSRRPAPALLCEAKAKAAADDDDDDSDEPVRSQVHEIPAAMLADGIKKGTKGQSKGSQKEAGARRLRRRGQR